MAHDGLELRQCPTARAGSGKDVGMTFRRQRLVRRRRMLGLSQQQLAEHVGVDRSTVVRWERGESAPHPWHRPRMARALKITAEELDDLLLDCGPANGPQTERLEHAAANPAGIDLVSVACLREQVTSLDAAYDTAPSSALLADAGRAWAKSASSAATPHPARCGGS